MDAEQIKKRLKVLDAYEMSQLRNTWDESDRVTDELLKILNTKSKLRAMLKEAEAAS